MQNQSFQTAALMRYYEQILAQADEFVNKNEYEQAVALLEDELAAPYVPSAAESLLQEKLTDIKAHYYYLNDLTTYEQLDRQQLFLKLYQNAKQFNLTVFNLFLERYSQSLSGSEIATINFFLQDVTGDLHSKELACLAMKNFGVKNQFLFFNQHCQKESLIIPTQTAFLHEINLYLETQKILDAKLDKEPSLFKMADEIIKLVYLYHFPDLAPIPPLELAHAILEYIWAAFQTTTDFKFQKHHALLKQVIISFQ